VTTRRDKLARLGDKLDAAELANDDAWITLFFKYETLVIERALASKPPKVKIKSTADMWAADRLWMTLWEREEAIKADSAANSAKGSRRMRTAADLAALLAVTDRDMRIVGAAIHQYKADKQANKQKAITIAKHRNQRVRAVAKAIHSAIGRNAS
jgi:hypothetical protein